VRHPWRYGDWLRISLGGDQNHGGRSCAPDMWCQEGDSWVTDVACGEEGCGLNADLLDIQA